MLDVEAVKVGDQVWLQMTGDVTVLRAVCVQGPPHARFRVCDSLTGEVLNSYPVLKEGGDYVLLDRWNGTLV